MSRIKKKLYILPEDEDHDALLGVKHRTTGRDVGEGWAQYEEGLEINRYKKVLVRRRAIRGLTKHGAAVASIEHRE